MMRYCLLVSHLLFLHYAYNITVVACRSLQNRTELALNGIQAAKDAGVGFLAVVSVSTAGSDTVFGRQFGPIEEATKASGLPYVLFRLPFFTDNLWYAAPPLCVRIVVRGGDESTYFSAAVTTSRAKKTGDAASAVVLGAGDLSPLGRSDSRAARQRQTFKFECTPTLRVSIFSRISTPILYVLKTCVACACFV